MDHRKIRKWINLGTPIEWERQDQENGGEENT